MLISGRNPGPGQPVSDAMTLGAFTARLLVIAIIGALAVALWRLTDVLVLMFWVIFLAIGLCDPAPEPPR